MGGTFLDRSGLGVATILANFLEQDVLPGTGIAADAFWRGLSAIYAAFAHRNAELLTKRDLLQARIDEWHRQRAGQPIDQAEYIGFLREIGYLQPEPAPFQISPQRVDREVAELAGPQLVVPISNARFLLNAANARWGSLYDALYGTDAISSGGLSGGYDSVRGDQVVAWAKDFLDRCVPLEGLRWSEWDGDGDPPLENPAWLAGRAGDNLLLSHHGLHIELVIDRSHPVGRADPAGISDMLLEAAITTIADLEDSVAAVDAQDKVAAYANWLGLMRGDLEATFAKDGRTATRRLTADRCYVGKDGSELRLPGRSLMFVRNVGHLMTTPALRLADGTEAPEGILDAVVTSLIALHDLQRDSKLRNSREGSIYIVKPKMHGPEECDFANDLFNAVEDLLGLPRHTIKVGIMDEERRTSANLAACIFAVKHRVVFINTGFLDRTGDEIHTSMLAGPMMRKGDMKSSSWLAAYEDRNVQVGLACGFSGRGQIGKGMWAAPDRMADMIEQKIVHPMSGANTAWVPNPAAATLHATHYHLIDVFARHRERAAEPLAALEQLLEIPLAAAGRNWSEDEVHDELDNNVQGVLGYVARWVGQGIGCSKIPDIHDVGLMEDRATLRISSQHVANWLLHGVVDPEAVESSLRRMAEKVDRQNLGDPAYLPMAANLDTHLAFQAARALLFRGGEQPSGYTEPLLHHFRRIAKQRP